MCDAVITLGDKKATKFIVSNLLFSGTRQKFTTSDILSDLEKYKISISSHELSYMLSEFCENGKLEEVGSFFALSN